MADAHLEARATLATTVALDPCDSQLRERSCGDAFVLAVKRHSHLPRPDCD